MRSFIKSHRKSSSLDSSPSRHCDKDSTRSSDEYTDNIPQIAPAQLPVLDKQPSQSMSFDSIHKLTNKNKIFSSRIFKKPGNNTFRMGDSTTAPTSPFMSSFRNLSSPETPQSSQFTRQTITVSQSQSDYEMTPTIKGTRLHDWGANSKERSQSVIVLNRNSTSSEASSDVIDSGFGGQVKRKTGSFSSATSSIVEENGGGSFDIQMEKLDELNECEEKHPYFSLRAGNGNKAKNRQARIHSHEDFLSMGKHSNLDLSSFTNTFELTSQGDEHATPTKHSLFNSESEPEDVEISQRFLGLGINRSQASNDDILSINSEMREQSIVTYDRSFEEGDEVSAIHEKPETKDFASEKESPESEKRDFSASSNELSDDESSDASSKFSFEAAGVNGRTASVKYYSKPIPQANVYVDDLYGEEDFDEDMNFFDDDNEDDTEFNHENPKIKQSKNDMSINGFNSIANISDSEDEITAGRVVNGYNDLFDISDDINDIDEKTQSSDHNEDDEGYDYQEDEENYTDDPDDSQSMKKTNLNSYGDIFDLGESDEEQPDINKVGYAYVREKPGESVTRSSYEKDDPSVQSKTENEHQLRELEQSVIHRTKPFGNSLLKSPASNSSTNSHVSSLRSPFSCETKVALPDNLNLSLPPPARSQVLKFHDLSSNLDYEVPGATSNLYFIDESEEDQYNKKNQSDDHYLDEINYLPEDYNFSDDEDYFLNGMESPNSNKKTNSFKKTHSFSRKPNGAVRENAPLNLKLEIKDKVVTFFHSPVNELDANPLIYSTAYESSESNANSPVEDWQKSNPSDPGATPVTPSNSLSRPSPHFSQGNSLSPIQETNLSVDSSPNANDFL
ncbi:LANO_0D01706g1_1 [Lachancea nothofagi CBS 11611]|uniref:LANO_0D01706g1_1 n=1 Tax=Lachancea nothofagi CBS 11611 TaxID=1266666 RepID=A0A1G4JDU7_9SACH|nr:LANO_0D01706g1_1 [Lachancea nothofagi CBS 11611]